MNLQQSELYRNYILRLKWNVTLIDGFAFYHKQIPFMGGLAKLQRSSSLPPVEATKKLLQTERIKTLVVEPEYTLNQKTLDDWCAEISKYVKIATSPYIPTKTIMVDLSPSEDEIFSRFSEAKRRAVRRAIKNKLTISESSDVSNLIKIKNRSAGLFGSITTYGVRELWEIFTEKNTTTILCYDQKTLLGGIFLLFHEDIAYYWVAGAITRGKKLAAPTYLVWEALKIAKKHHAKRFDFVGVWDERIPKENHAWLGFTKFKEGFGGTPVYYPLATR